VLSAALVAVLHGAVVALVLTGSLLALRWPRVMWLHVPVALAVLGLYLTGSDCPLTTWELSLREAAGAPLYRGGFLGHYFTEPMGFPIEATSTQAGVYVVALLPNLVGYGLLITRRHRRRIAATPRIRAERRAPTRRSARAPGTRRRALRRRTPGWPAAAHRGGRRTS
jgi:hypothetical protein